MTLIETLVGLTIFVIVTGLLATILNTSSRTHSRTLRRAEVQSASRQALALLTTELRQAGADPSNPPVGIVGIASADVNAIRVRADVSGDGVIQTAEPSEDVAYAYNAVARTLTRDPGTGPVVALDNVTTFQLSYFDAAGQPLATLPLSAANRALVHAIGLNLTCELRDSRPFTLTTRVTLRNQ